MGISDYLPLPHPIKSLLSLKKTTQPQARTSLHITNSKQVLRSISPASEKWVWHQELSCPWPGGFPEDTEGRSCQVQSKKEKRPNPALPTRDYKSSDSALALDSSPHCCLSLCAPVWTTVFRRQSVNGQ